MHTVLLHTDQHWWWQSLLMVLYHTHPWTHSCIQQSPLKRDADKHLLFTAWQKRALNVTYFCFSLIHKWRGMEENKPFPSLPCRSWRKAFLSRCTNKTCLVCWSSCHGTHAIHLSGAPKAVASPSYLHTTSLDILFQPRVAFRNSTVWYFLYWGME